MITPYFKEILDDFDNLSVHSFFTKYGPRLYQKIADARKGRMVIRLIEGGNEYMKMGDSHSGTTRAFAVGLPLVIEYPNGYYQSSEVQSIDWEAGTFRAVCSTYHFHFLTDQATVG